MTRQAVRWHEVAGRRVRSVVVGTPRRGVPELVLVPGLGALGYLQPTVRACAAWTRVHLLDVPGFGHRSTARCPADLGRLGGTVAHWLAQVPPEPVLLLGHSTGAQVALRAALQHEVHALVLGGVTFSPAGRRLLPLLGQVLRTLPHEQPAELPAVLPYYLRGALRLPQLLRSALADRPEDAVGDVAAPVHVVRGRHDALCPQDWADQLATRARAGRAYVLPGGHNVPWTSPVELSELLRTLSA